MAVRRQDSNCGHPVGHVVPVDDLERIGVGEEGCGVPVVPHAEEDEAGFDPLQRGIEQAGEFLLVGGSGGHGVFDPGNRIQGGRYVVEQRPGDHP